METEYVYIRSIGDGDGDVEFFFPIDELREHFTLLSKPLGKIGKQYTLTWKYELMDYGHLVNYMIFEARSHFPHDIWNKGITIRGTFILKREVRDPSWRVTDWSELLSPIGK